MNNELREICSGPGPPPLGAIVFPLNIFVELTVYIYDSLMAFENECVTNDDT